MAGRPDPTNVGPSAPGLPRTRVRYPVPQASSRDRGGWRPRLGPSLGASPSPCLGPGVHKHCTPNPHPTPAARGCRSICCHGYLLLARVGSRRFPTTGYKQRGPLSPELGAQEGRDRDPPQRGARAPRTCCTCHAHAARTAPPPRAHKTRAPHVCAPHAPRAARPTSQPRARPHRLTADPDPGGCAPAWASQCLHLQAQPAPGSHPGRARAALCCALRPL